MNKDLNSVLCDQYYGLLDGIDCLEITLKDERQIAWAAQTLFNIIQIIEASKLQNRVWSSKLVHLQDYDDCVFYIQQQIKGEK
jgi:hypothetical protein